MDKIRLTIRCTESYTYYRFSVRLLQNNFHDTLHDVLLETRYQMWFQHDGIQFLLIIVIHVV